MEDRMLISVRVKGNPCETSGFNSLISLNNPGFDYEDISYSGFENCPYFFSIKTDEKQTIYRLIKNGVKSYGASRGGSLIIAFSIPNGFKLDGGKTPYGVLCRFKDVFLENGMTPQTVDVYQYKFNSSSAYANILDSTVKEFSLVRETAVRHFPMTGSKAGLIIRPEEEIKKFFEDITYPEFADYCEILVATQCFSQYLYEVLHVEIPRPKRYRIIYKDNSTAPFEVSDFNKNILVRSNKPDKYYQNTVQDFTINQLLNKTANPLYVDIDEVREEIRIDTSRMITPPKRKEIKLDINPERCEGGIRNKLSLTDAKSHELRQESGKVIFEAEQIDFVGNSRPSVRIIGDDRYEIKNIRWEGDRLVVDVAEKPKPQPVYPQYVNNGGQSHNVSEPCVEITISLTKDFCEREARGGSQLLVRLQDSQSKDEFTFQRRVNFDLASDGGYKGQFSVMKSQCDGVELVIEGKKKILSSSRISLGNKQKLELSQEHFEENKKHADSKGYLCLIIALIMFMLGCAVGYCFLANNNGIAFNNKKVAFLNDARLKLESVDLTIARIDSIYDIYRSDKKKYQGRDADICNKIYCYHELSEGIKGGNVQKINTCINNNYISEAHIGFINRIVRDEQSKEWFGGKQYQGIENLKDIEKIYEYYCDDCKKYFKDEGTINNHKKIECTWTGKNGMCQEKFCTVAGLQKHQEEAKHKSQQQVKTNSGVNTYTCTKCNPPQEFKTEKEYNSHMKNHKQK